MDEFSDIEPYYVYHFIIFFSYLIVRTSAIQIFSSNFSYLLVRKEIQAKLALLMLLVKEESWEGFLSDVLFFSKFLLLIDIQLALLLHEPPYSELGHATRLTPLQLEVILIEGSALRFWLVTLNSSNCIRTSRFISISRLLSRTPFLSPACFLALTLTLLSTGYSNKSLSFG
ncbi:hypothetical protein MKW92_013335 [Papaver armeniacum]|nr:hypothetical protein MKW92_013335 [Papaver armeniacum]